MLCWNDLLQEGHGGTGRKSRGSSSSGRDGGRERTGRNIISNDSARVSHGGASVEDTGDHIAVDGLFSSKPRDSTGGGVGLGGGGYSRRKTVPEPPPYHDDDTAVTREPQLPVPSSSFSVNSRSTALAPESTVPERNDGGHRGAAGAQPGVVLDDPVYLVTDTYPYTFKQFDRQDEERLLVSKRVFVRVCFLFACVYLATTSRRRRNPPRIQVFPNAFSIIWVLCGGMACGCVTHNPVPCLQGFRISGLSQSKITRIMALPTPTSRCTTPTHVTRSPRTTYTYRVSISVG